MCTKCGVRHSAPTGKKCAHVGEIEKSTLKSKEGAVSNCLQVPSSVGSKAVEADLLTPAVAVDEQIDEVEKSVSQIGINLLEQIYCNSACKILGRESN